MKSHFNHEKENYYWAQDGAQELRPEHAHLPRYRGTYCFEHNPKGHGMKATLVFPVGTGGFWLIAKFDEQMNYPEGEDPTPAGVWITFSRESFQIDELAEQQPVGEMISNDGDIYWTDRHPPMGAKLYTAPIAQTEQQPVRVVVDISGGAIHGVYADRPVTIYFKSDDPDDVAQLLRDLDESETDKDMEGEPIASWVRDAEIFSDIVDHYHNQAKESGND